MAVKIAQRWYWTTVLENWKITDRRLSSIKGAIFHVKSVVGICWKRGFSWTATFLILDSWIQIFSFQNVMAYHKNPGAYKTDFLAYVVGTSWVHQCCVAFLATPFARKGFHTSPPAPWGVASTSGGSLLDWELHGKISATSLANLTNQWIIVPSFAGVSYQLYDALNTMNQWTHLPNPRLFIHSKWTQRQR